MDIKISKKSLNLKLFLINFHKNHFWNTTFSKNCDFDYVLFFNNVCLCYMMSKLVFQFRKNESKKSSNILKNSFTKSILKNTKKKSIFLKLKQTHPIFYFRAKLHIWSFILFFCNILVLYLSFVTFWSLIILSFCNTLVLYL